MQEIQLWAAKFALVFVTTVLIFTFISILFRWAAAQDFLALTQLLLSWPVAAGGLVFGGGQAIVRTWNATRKAVDDLGRE